MTPNHVSELAIDRLLAGELPSADATSVRDHAAGCPRCSAALDDALVGQDAFARHRPSLRLPRRRVAAVATMMMACAATLAVVLAWPHPRDVVRTKGSAIVGFFVAHGDQVRRGAPREVVVPGDRVELYTTSAEPTWFAAISDDATGVRSVYVPARSVAAGREALLPMAIELDGLGTEVVTGMFCPFAFDPRGIDPLAIPPGCSIDRFTLVLVPR